MLTSIGARGVKQCVNIKGLYPLDLCFVMALAVSSRLLCIYSVGQLCGSKCEDLVYVKQANIE